MGSRLIKLITTFAVLMSFGNLSFAQTVKLRLMETSDIHVHLMNYDYYQDKPSDTFGLVRTATLIKKARKEVKNSLLFDNGDLIQGNPLGDYVVRGRALRFGEIHPVYKALNYLEYDAGNIGNHEFNYGMDFLMKSLAGANFPYVNSNVYFDDGDNNSENDQNYFQPYVLLNRTFTDESGNEHDLKVGVIGFVPPQIMMWDNRNLAGKVIVKDIVDSAKKYVPQMMKEGADVIVAVPHSGLNPKPRQGMDANTVYYLAKVPGIDAILFGHSHVVFPGPQFEGIEGIDNKKGTVFGVGATEPGFWGGHLGLVDLVLEKQNGEWNVIDTTGSTRAIYKREGRKKIPLVESDMVLANLVTKDHEETLAYMRKKVGESLARIHSFFSLVQDDPSVQLVNLAQQWYVKNIVQGTELDGLPILSAAAPFKAGGRGGAEYYTDVPAGDIALKNVADLYIYPNDLKVVKLKGADIKDYLERSAAIFNQIDPKSSEEQNLVSSAPSYNFDVIDGVTYEIDVTQPSKYGPRGKLLNAGANRIKNLRYNRNPIDMSKDFLLVSNNYRAGGGGTFPGMDGSSIVIHAPDKNRDVIAGYFLSQGTFNPSADGNWTFAPIGGNANVTFQTAVSARALIEAHPQMSFLRVDGSGFAVVKLDL